MRRCVRPLTSTDSGTSQSVENRRARPTTSATWVLRAWRSGFWCVLPLTQDIKRHYPTIVELGAGAGHLRKFLDAEGTGVQKLIMCDTSGASMWLTQRRF